MNEFKIFNHYILNKNKFIYSSSENVLQLSASI